MIATLAWPMRKWQRGGTSQQACERWRCLSVLSTPRTEPGDDHELHAQLGFLKQMNGQPAAAVEEYQMALEADPDDSLAAGDLAIMKAGQHQYAEAVAFVEARSLITILSQLGAGMNLAIVECGVGETGAALATLGTDV